MRIDKYLWCVRLYKTRSQATQGVKKDRVLVDDQEVKPSKELKVGDEFEVKRHGFTLRFKVLGFPKSRVGAKLVSDYLLDITPKEEMDKKAVLDFSRQSQRRKGLGRPTKKDRRNLDDWFNEP